MKKGLERMKASFFHQDALVCAPLLLGKKLVRYFEDGHHVEGFITEIEVYRGEEDLACHASKGRTPRTEVFYGLGGRAYVYLIYGRYWLFNIVTGLANQPQAILIRSLDSIQGPGRVGRALQLDKSFYGEDLITSLRLWVEDAPIIPSENILTGPRIGINYAGEWIQQPWRFWYVRA